MLQTISKHIQGWIAGVIIAIIAAAFVLFRLEYYISRGGEQQTSVASVNGVKITAQQLNNAYDSLQRNYAQQGVTLNEQAQQQLRNLALQQLILDQVLLQTAGKMGFAISMSEIQRVILQIPAFQENGQFSPQRFQQLLSNNGISPEAFLQKVKASLLVSQLLSGIQASAFVTPSELAKAYGLLHQQRSFGYFILPSAAFTAAAQPTDAQINNYYQQHAEQFRTPEQVKIAYLWLNPESLKSEVKVIPEQIQQYYQDNEAAFAGKSLPEVQTSIESRLSQQQLGQLLAAKGGQLQDLTYTNPSSLNDAAKALGLPVKTTDWVSSPGIKGDPLFSDSKVLAAVFSDEVLKQNNNSQPIELKDGGLLVVRIAEHQPSQNQPLAAVRDQIKAQLQKDQGQKQAGLQAYEIQQALQTGTLASALASRYHLAWVTKTNVTRDDKAVPPALLSAVFSLAPNPDAAKKAVTSILLPDGRYAIIQLESLNKADASQIPSAEQEKLRNQLANRGGELDYELFAKSALDKAKISSHGGIYGH